MMDDGSRRSWIENTIEKDMMVRTNMMEKTIPPTTMIVR